MGNGVKEGRVGLKQNNVEPIVAARLLPEVCGGLQWICGQLASLQRKPECQQAWAPSRSCSKHAIIAPFQYKHL